MGSSDSFVHLHTHTEYSMLDGAARLTDLFAEAARMGMPAGGAARLNRDLRHGDVGSELQWNGSV